MNQILSIDNTPRKENRNTNKTKNKGPIEINSILKFFSISLIVFGILMIGTGSYSMYQGSKNSTSLTKPPIFVEENSETELTLKIKHDKELSKVTYNWNDEEETIVDANGKKNIEQKIEIPEGTNILNIYVSDINGQETRYQKEYTGVITIDFEVTGDKIKIMTEGKNEISYITYRWDENEETRVDINSLTAEQTIEIPKGLHKLTVIAVDINNNTETKEQKIEGVTKPKIEITTDGENFIIKASDEQGLKKIEFLINGSRKKINEENLAGKTEVEFKYPLSDGENQITVLVYNKAEATHRVKAKATK